MSGTLTSSASTHSLPDEKPDKQHAHSARVDIDPSQVDTAAALVAGADIRVDPAEAARVRRKIDRHLMPLMCFLYMCVHYRP
jgi:ACS family allantoate permease-like MFS transporter